MRINSLFIYIIKHIIKIDNFQGCVFTRHGERLRGHEVMYMIRKGQVEGVGKGEIINQIECIEALKNYLESLFKRSLTNDLS